MDLMRSPSISSTMSRFTPSPVPSNSRPARTYTVEGAAHSSSATTSVMR